MNNANQTQAPAPLLEKDRASFVWHGDRSPGLIGDFNNWDEDRPLCLEESQPDVWTRTLEFPPEAYIEYAYLVDGERVFDPLNVNVIYNGMDAFNHYFYMPEGGPTRLAQYRLGVARGQVIHKKMESASMLMGGSRPVDFYRPPLPGPTPLIVVFDGNDYNQRARLVPMIDNLIAENRIRPVSLAMIHNSPGRMVEYACSDATLGDLLYNLLPLASKTLDLLDIQEHPGAYGVLGASMGGLMALYTGIRLPRIFGRVLSQSGAFNREFVLFDLIRKKQTLPLKIWMDVGRFEFLYEPNQEMHALLTDQGYDIAYREYPAGHNYPAWRDDVWRGLEHLFPPEKPASAVSA